MAKVSFSKLDAKINNSVTTISFSNTKNEKVDIEVKNYLPIEEKIVVVMNVLNQSIDNNGYYNPLRINMYTALEMIYAYTNLSFTAKQKDNIFKLYDQLKSSGVVDKVKSAVPSQEWDEIESYIITMIDNVYKYRNSIVGILDIISQDYNNLNFDVTALQESLSNPENLELLKSIMTKLG